MSKDNFRLLGQESQKKIPPALQNSGRNHTWIVADQSADQLFGGHAQANNLSSEALTREQWVATDAWLASLDRPPGTTEPVAPRLQCVKETGNRLEASFSYFNPNSFAVFIPVGPRNHFSPAPEDRQQPTTFLPGVHERVVSIVVEGKKKDPSRTIAWTIDDRMVSAPTHGVPKCKNN